MLNGGQKASPGPGMPQREVKPANRVFGRDAVQASRRRTAEDLRRLRFDELRAGMRKGGETEAQHLHRLKKEADAEDAVQHQLQANLLAEAEEFYDEQDRLCDLYVEAMKIDEPDLSRPVSPLTVREPAT